MIEKKFTELVRSFLQGEIGPTESTWLVEELHKRRDRRDLFMEKMEEYLEYDAGPARRESDRQLRELLTRDLTTIQVRDIELAKPRRSTPIPSAEIPEQYQQGGGRSEPLKVNEPKEYFTEKVEKLEEERSLLMPVLGILIIIATFFVLIQFSSLEEDSVDEAELANIEENASENATAFREVNEFLAENRGSSNVEVEEEGDASAEVSGPIKTPVSLADLVGGDSSNSGSTAGADDALVLQNP